MALTPDRRAALVAARSSVVVRDHFGVDIAPADWVDIGGGGAAASDGESAWVAPADEAPVALGAALAWARRKGAAQLHLIVVPSEGAGPLGEVARRAAHFARPPSVWELSGRTLVEVEPADPEPIRVPPPATAESILLLEQAGVDVVVEEGVVIGELRGLEIARVIVDEPEGSDVPVARIEVGVGRFDREAFALMHGDLSPPAALARVAAEIDAIRRADAEPHPINRIARERWLRHQLIADPSLVGAAELTAADGARRRGGLRETGVAMAIGRRTDGTPIVVATSVGVDLEAVPDAADARARLAPDAHLVLVVPPRDDHRITREVAALLARPAEVVTVDGAWPA